MYGSLDDGMMDGRNHDQRITKNVLLSTKCREFKKTTKNNDVAGYFYNVRCAKGTSGVHEFVRAIEAIFATAKKNEI